MVIKLLQIRSMVGSSIKNDLSQLPMSPPWSFITLSGLISLKRDAETLVLGLSYYRGSLGLKVRINLSFISREFF